MIIQNIGKNKKATKKELLFGDDKNLYKQSQVQML